eukprot:TRINITY_DN13828_c0_g1_i2.p1 TRINITY_DN13828_c0_g1~~TRINITY_DN13828_c0_g1_i2.p1  ORF type:complete len:139 (-),score=41.18 TRINITY_DN13828_c0_g1_i2:70-486(-)
MEFARKLLIVWNKMLESNDVSSVDSFFAEDIILKSPVLWKPKEGKPAVRQILMNAKQIFEDFKYHRQWISEDGKDWVLEFSAKVDGKDLKGFDVIKLDDDFKMKEFEVAIRPINSLHIFGKKMSDLLLEQEMKRQSKL